MFGTAAAFGGRGIQALAKTGTAVATGGGQQGLVVAMWPADAPQRAAVVVVSGGSGPDAAVVAADIARSGRPSSAPGAPQSTAVAPAAVPTPAGPTVTGDSPPVAEESTQIRVGFAQAGGGYSVRSLALEDYVARVLAGEAARPEPASRSRGTGDHGPARSRWPTVTAMGKTASISARRHIVRSCGSRRQRLERRRQPQPDSCSPGTGNQRRSTTRPLAVAGASARPMCGPAPTIHHSCPLNPTQGAPVSLGGSRR